MDYGLEKRIRDTFRWKESWDNLGIEIIKRNFQSSFKLHFYQWYVICFLSYAQFESVS